MPTSLTYEELIDNTIAWVVGKLLTVTRENGYYDTFYGTDGKLDSIKFDIWVYETHTVVWRYLKQGQAPGAEASDTAASLATQARYVFGHHFTD